MNYLQYLKPIESANVPDPLVPFSEKLKPEYGLKIAKAIQQEWFAGGLIDNNGVFSKRHQWIREMRLYNRGQQDIEVYKNLVARQKGDLEFLNLDWRPLNLAEKFTNIVRNGIDEQYYRLDVRSADRLSVMKKNKSRERHLRNMYNKDMFERANDLLGIDMRPRGFVPEDETEINLYAEVMERPAHEIAEEIMIDYVKGSSRWDSIKNDADADLVVADLMVARCYTDYNNGVTPEYIDPEVYGHSYVERKDFSDAYYHFTVRDITINDLRRESGFPDHVCRAIAKLYSGQNKTTITDWDGTPMENILDFNVQVMYFAYKTDKEIVYKAYLDKRNRTNKVAMRDGSYQVPEGAEGSKLEKRLDTWLEGNYVIGSNEFIYDYRECERIARDSRNAAVSPFVVRSTNLYKNELKSFLSNIIPLLDQMHLQHLKIQHLIAELKPDLISLDIDALADLNPDQKGESKMANWKTALSILNAKGVVITKRINMGEDGIKEQAGARPIPNQQGSALAALLNVWAHYYNLIREITGINPAVDGSLPADALVGVNQMMRLAANTATKHIVDAATDWDKEVCEVISTRIKAIFGDKNLKHLRDMYEEAVGKRHVEAMDALKDRHIHEFGFTVEMVPAKEELDYLREDLAIAIKEGTVDVSEKAQIMQIAKSNMKNAVEYMAFVRRRKIKEATRMNEYNMAMQKETNIQSTQAAAEAEVNKYQAFAQIDLQKEAQMSAIRLRERATEHQIDAPAKQIEFEQKAYLEQMKALTSINLTKYKEDEKAKRERENSTRQSKMIEQRQRDLPAFDFSNEIDIDKLLRI